MRRERFPEIVRESCRRSRARYRDKYNRRQNEKYHLAVYGHVLETPEDIITYGKDRYKAARAIGFRSGLEVSVARQLDAAGVPYDYEKYVIRYSIPARVARFTPDWVLKNGIVIESKGHWVTSDRQKIRLVKEQHPDLDLRMLFGSSKSTIGRKSSTTYGIYCDRLGIPYADKTVPKVWLKERPCPKRIAAAAAAFDIPLTAFEHSTKEK